MRAPSTVRGQQETGNDQIISAYNVHSILVQFCRLYSVIATCRSRFGLPVSYTVAQRSLGVNLRGSRQPHDTLREVNWELGWDKIWERSTPKSPAIHTLGLERFQIGMVSRSRCPTLPAIACRGHDHQKHNAAARMVIIARYASI